MLSECVLCLLFDDSFRHGHAHARGRRRDASADTEAKMRMEDIGEGVLDEPTRNIQRQFLQQYKEPS